MIPFKFRRKQTFDVYNSLPLPHSTQHEGIEVTTTDNPRPRIHEQVKSPSDITFGKHFSDHMLLCHWDRETGWERPKIVPYGDIPMSPALSALHYDTEVSSITTYCCFISPQQY